MRARTRVISSADGIASAAAHRSTTDLSISSLSVKTSSMQPPVRHPPSPCPFPEPASRFTHTSGPVPAAGAACQWAQEAAEITSVPDE
jgi:hypothetical protein